MNNKLSHVSSPCFFCPEFWFSYCWDFRTDKNTWWTRVPSFHRRDRSEDIWEARDDGHLQQGTGSRLGTTSGIKAEEKHTVWLSQRRVYFWVPTTVSRWAASVHLRKGRRIHAKSFQALPNRGLWEHNIIVQWQVQQTFVQGIHVGNQSHREGFWPHHCGILAQEKGPLHGWCWSWSWTRGSALNPSTDQKPTGRKPQPHRVTYLLWLSPRHAAPALPCSPSAHKFFFLFASHREPGHGGDPGNPGA